MPPAPRTAIAPELPPDHPLEPGTRPSGAHVFAVGTDRGFRKRDQRNRFRAEGAGQFVELHCRRAPRRAGRGRRAAAREGGTRAKAAPKDKGGDKAKAGDKADDKTPSTITSKIRSLLVGASVVVIVLGTFKMAMTLLDTGSVLQLPMMEQSERAGRTGAGPRAGGEQHQAGNARSACAGALDDLADAGREAVEQFFRAEHAG